MPNSITQDIYLQIHGKNLADPTLRGVQNSLMNMNTTTAALTVALGASVAAIGSAVKEYARFEDKLADVGKTTGLAGEGLKAFGDDLLKMSRHTPLAVSGLQDIAIIGGQLGIKTTEDLLSFTKTVEMMAIAFDDVDARSAAEQMAGLSISLNEPIANMERMGDVVNALSNNANTGAAAILNISSRLAGSAEMFGLTTDEVFALSSTLASLKVPAQIAGTAMSKLMLDMMANVPKYAESAGISIEKFSELIRTKPVEAFKLWIAQMGEMDKFNLAEKLQEMKVGGARLAEAILKLSGKQGYEEFNRQLKIASDEMERGGSLAKEAAVKYGTLSGEAGKLKNAWSELKTQAGSLFADGVNESIKFGQLVALGWSEIFKQTDNFIDNFAEGVVSFNQAIEGDTIFDMLKNQKDGLKDITYALAERLGKEKELQTLLKAGISLEEAAYQIRHKNTDEIEEMAWAINNKLIPVMNQLKKTMSDVGSVGIDMWDALKDATKNVIDNVTSEENLINVYEDDIQRAIQESIRRQQEQEWMSGNAWNDPWKDQQDTTSKTGGGGGGYTNNIGKSPSKQGDLIYDPNTGMIYDTSKKGSDGLWDGYYVGPDAQIIDDNTVVTQEGILDFSHKTVGGGPTTQGGSTSSDKAKARSQDRDAYKQSVYEQMGDLPGFNDDPGGGGGGGGAKNAGMKKDSSKPKLNLQLTFKGADDELKKLVQRILEEATIEAEAGQAPILG